MAEWTQWLLPISLILFISLIGSLLAKHFHKPNIVFFIVLGIITTNFIQIPGFSQELLTPLAGLGIVLLLFTIGLELPLNKLIKAGKYLFFGSILQMLLSSLIIGLGVWLLFGSLSLALMLCLPLAMSSTAVIGKLLQEKGEDSSLTGEITLGVLIVQDLVSVVIITLFTFLTAKANISLGLLGLELFKILTIVVVLYFILSVVLDRLLEKTRLGREDLSLFIFALLFFFLWLFTKLSLPETTAGFVIGVLLAQRVEQYEIFSQVRVFRDIFLVLFFFFLGTYIQNLNFLVIAQAGILAALFMFFKFVITWFSFVFLGMHKKTAYWVGFDLMQHGEFGFIILSILYGGKLINYREYQLFILVIIWSLLYFSLIYKQKLHLYRIINRYVGGIVHRLSLYSKAKTNLTFDQLDYENHIVLCGYGRVGAYIGHGLILSKLPLIVIDTEVDRIKKLIARGVKAIYGDATELEILDYAQVEKASFLIISVPNPNEQEQIILTAKKLNPKIEIITCSHLSKQLRHLKSLGVNLIYQPEFEAALSMLKRILKIYQFDKSEIKKRIQYLKMEHGTE